MSTPNYATQRPRTYWSPQCHQKFVELCVEQVRKRNRPARCFNQAGWEAIIERFTQTTGLHYDQKQMKNHYDSTKRLWKAWKALTGKSNMGFEFDPILRTITAPDEAWAAYILANPRAAKLRNRPLKFEDQLDTIFGRTAMTGDNALAPSSSILHNNVVNITPGSQDPFPGRHSQCLEETSTSPSMAHHEVDMVDNNHRKSNLVMKRSMEPTSSSSRNSKRVAEGGAKMAD
ncbi:Myb/SANT-like domain-containing protein [Cinnamomum micranthum f. kanehirae]|uniref:Myb/SANT-like domain-containing protein n=1 Tax=Cinnamomum micranthum f. kanehirae TaxID=337451 RepID=A0A3S3MVP5_9MAGN|nr:Myb/SANT-like domain-containing protein [Cinnamomum micranthum f. kanehirae]